MGLSRKTKYQALCARMPKEDSTSILKREVCRWCGIKSKKEGCPEPNQSQGRKDREAAAGTGGLGVGWGWGNAGTQFRAQGSELVGGACFCSPAPGDISLPLLQLLSH